MNIEDYESVKRWFDALQVQEACSEETFNQYRWGFQIFIDWAGKSPDELIEERVEDLGSKDITIIRRAKDRLTKFVTSEVINKNTGKPFKETTKKHIVRMVQSFYEKNDVQVKLTIATSRPKRESVYIPSREDIQKMIRTRDNPRAQALIIMQAEMGWRIGAMVELRWKHVKGGLKAGINPALIIAPIMPTTNKKATDTFIAEDAVSYLCHYLNTREELQDEDLIFDIDRKRAGDIVKEAGKDIGIANEGLSAFTSHCFRRRLETLLEQAGTPLNWVDYLIGHTPRGAQASAYSKPSTEDLRKAYAKALPLVRVF